MRASRFSSPQHFVQRKSSRRTQRSPSSRSRTIPRAMALSRISALGHPVVHERRRFLVHGEELVDARAALVAGEVCRRRSPRRGRDDPARPREGASLHRVGSWGDLQAGTVSSQPLASTPERWRRGGRARFPCSARRVTAPARRSVCRVASTGWPVREPAPRSAASRGRDLAVITTSDPGAGSRAARGRRSCRSSGSPASGRCRPARTRPGPRREDVAGLAVQAREGGVERRGLARARGAVTRKMPSAGG